MLKNTNLLFFIIIIQYSINTYNIIIQLINIIRVTAIWTLTLSFSPSAEFDIFVSDCYAHDGMDMGYLEMIDSNGCPTHRKIIGNQQHSTDLAPGDTLVYAHFKAFKFPDVNNVFFECQCRLCMENCFQVHSVNQCQRNLSAILYFCVTSAPPPHPPPTETMHFAREAIFYNSFSTFQKLESWCRLFNLAISYL